MIYKLTTHIDILLVSVHRHCQCGYSRKQEGSLPLPCTLSECSAICQLRNNDYCNKKASMGSLLSPLDQGEIVCLISQIPLYLKLRYLWFS